jgi:hypothetical protein
MLADKQDDRSRCTTLGANKACKCEGTRRRRASLDGRTPRHGYGISLTCHWLMERASNSANHRLPFNRWL